MVECKKCGRSLGETERFCSNCGSPAPSAENRSKASGLGIAALVLGIIALCFFWTPLIGPYYSSPLLILFFFVTLPISIISIVFGAVSFWGKWRDKLGLVGFIAGIISLVVGLIIVIIKFSTMYYY